MAQSPFDISDEQMRALDLSRLVFLSAAAGSGKTRVLVARFLWALEQENGRVERVAAITFTEKAAAELSERVRVAVRVQTERDTGSFWPQALSSLSRARISTIHGFCATLLKEHALEAELDPDFEQADAATAQILVDEAIAGLLDSLGRQPVAGDAQELYHALGEVSLPNLRAHLRKLHDRRDLAVPWARRLLEGGEAPIDLAARLEGSQALANAHERWLARTLGRHPLLAQLGASLEAVPAPPRSLALYDTVLEVRAGITAVAADDSEPNRSRLFALLADLEKRLERVPKAFDQLAAVRLGERLRPLSALLPRALEPPDAVDDLEANRALYLRSLARLFRLSLERLAELKQRHRLVDFQDLQEKTLALLQRDDLGARIRSRLGHLLVDEFQDTDPLQWEIFLHLFGDGRELTRAGLCLVGDEKQSIYGFRSAEVVLGAYARAAIADANQRLGLVARAPLLPGSGVVLTEAEQRGLFELRETYRFLPDLARFHNELFANLFPSHPERDIDARYTAMMAAGERTKIARPARIEMLLCPEREAGPALVAQRVRVLLAEKRVIHDKERKVDRQLTAGDIAILLRDRGPLRQLETALTAARVAYLVSGGTGYYSRPEVIDLLNLLRFAARPDDSVSLMGLLRSPFFALEDATLYALAAERRGSLWSRLAASVREPNRLLDESALLLARRVRATLSELLALSARMPPAEWLKLGCERTGFLLALAAGPRAQMDRQNVDKFLDLVRSLTRRGASLAQIALTIERHTEGEFLEGEAETDLVDEGRIRVSTIHAAKGLEFPVVIVPDLGAPIEGGERDGLTMLGTRSAPLVSARIDDDDWRPRKLGWRAYVEHERRQRELAEERRVLYVALTRAQEMLVLQGQDELRANTYQAWIDRALGGLTTRADVHILRAADLAPDEPDRATPAAAAQVEPVDLIEPRFDPMPEPHLTATSVGDLLACPRKFYYSTLLGVPERPLLRGHLRSPGTAAPARTELAAFVRGRLLHRLLQHLVGRRRTAADVAALARRFTRDEGIESDEVAAQVADAAARAFAQFTQSEPGAELARARAVYCERSFELELAGARLRGQIDLMIHARDGRHLIVDYKTDEGVHSEAQALQLSEAMGYRHQLLFYALAVDQLAKPSAIAAYLFFTELGSAVLAADTSPLALSVFRAKLAGLLTQAQAEDVQRGYPCTSEESVCESCGFKARRICSKWADDDLTADASDGGDPPPPRR